MLMLGKKPVSPLCMPYAGFEKATNCLLEIPHNIKLTLENNVLTLKAGSTAILVLPEYTTITYNSDISYDFSNLSNGRYVVFSVPYQNNVLYPTRIETISSGTENPSTGSGGDRFFNVNDMRMYSRGPNSWNLSNICYPSCVVDVVNSVASFAKDSNGNNMIFNGAGFIGHHAFVYPNVNALIPNGLNSDGSYKTIEVTTNSLQIRELAFNRINVIINITSTATTNLHRRYYSVKDINDIDTNQSCSVWYVSNQNILYLVDDNKSISILLETLLINYSSTNSIITDFTIQQPLTKYKWVVKLIP